MSLLPYADAYKPASQELYERMFPPPAREATVTWQKAIAQLKD